MLAGVLCQAEHAAEIGVDHRLPILLRMLDGGRAPNDPGVVDENIDDAKMADYLFNQQGTNRGVADIANDCELIRADLA